MSVDHLGLEWIQTFQSLWLESHPGDVVVYNQNRILRLE